MVSHENYKHFIRTRTIYVSVINGVLQHPVYELKRVEKWHLWIQYWSTEYLFRTSAPHIPNPSSRGFKGGFRVPKTHLDGVKTLQTLVAYSCEIYSISAAIKCNSPLVRLFSCRMCLKYSRLSSTHKNDHPDRYENFPPFPRHFLTFQYPTTILPSRTSLAKAHDSTWSLW